MDRSIVVVIDTSTLLFWTLENHRLSPAATVAINDAERVAVSSISIWEIGIKVSKGRLSIPVSIREFADRLLQVDAVEVLPVDHDTWLQSIELRWEHKDPADRVIVATAILRNCPLVTSDETIRRFYPKSIW